MKHLTAPFARVRVALSRMRIAISLCRDTGLCYTWERAWRRAGELAK